MGGTARPAQGKTVSVVLWMRFEGLGRERLGAIGIVVLGRPRYPAKQRFVVRNGSGNHLRRLEGAMAVGIASQRGRNGGSLDESAVLKGEVFGGAGSGDFPSLGQRPRGTLQHQPAFAIGHDRVREVVASATSHGSQPVVSACQRGFTGPEQTIFVGASQFGAEPAQGGLRALHRREVSRRGASWLCTQNGIHERRVQLGIRHRSNGLSPDANDHLLFG